MALINCPECGKQISCHAKFCIHCGMPIEEYHKQEQTNTHLCKVSFGKFISNKMWSNNRFEAFAFIEKIYENYKPQAEHINCNKSCILFDGISDTSAEMIRNYLEPKGCRIVIENSELLELSELDKKIQLIYENSMILKCPRCGSTAITTGERGFSFITGFLGSNKTVNRCGKCGYSWQPK